MCARSPIVLRSCAGLRAEGIPLFSPLADAPVAAQNIETGRLRRVLTSEAVRSFTPDELAPYLPCPLEKATMVPWYFDPIEGYLMPEPFLDRPEIKVRFTAQPQRHGVRWLYVCPTCEQSTRHIYAVLTCDPGEDEVGCRRCLCLAYASQTRHRTRRGDADILNRLRLVSSRVFRQAIARDEKRGAREDKKLESMARTLGKHRAFLEDSEAVRALYSTGEIERLPPLDRLRLQDPDLRIPVNDWSRVTDEEGAPG